MTAPLPRRTDGPATILRTSGISLSYDGVRALEGLSLRLGERERLGLIGPNGSGKTTCFNCLSGFQFPDSGRIWYGGREITRVAAHARARAGIARSFQHPQLSPVDTVLDNAMVARHPVMRSGWLRQSVGWSSARSEERRARQVAWCALDRLGLADQAHRRARELPAGTRKLVDIARALAARPRVLLLDEPAAGLDPDEAGRLAESLAQAHRELGFALVVIDHNLVFVGSLCERVVVLAAGRHLTEGTPNAVRADPRVLAAYLGGDPEDPEEVDTGGSAAAG